MEEILSWLRPILSGLVGGLFVWGMVALTKNESKRVGNIRYLYYGKGFKIFSALIIPAALFVLYAVSKSYQGQEVAAFFVAGLFLFCGVFLPYQAFLVSFSYDDEFIYYKSPICGSKKVPWSNLRKAGYSWVLQADYIVVGGIGKIWCSNMLNGYIELAEFLEQKVPDLPQANS